MTDQLSRRSFLETSAAAAAAMAVLPRTAAARAIRGVPLRVGLIGCGGRGTGAARDIVTAAPDVTITAMGDLFPDRLARSKAQLTEVVGANLRLEGREFSGFDAFTRVLATDCDLVILATPPGFRPQHLAAAVDARKHIFTEKPVAVDPVGVRAVIAAAERAAANGTAIVAGTQRRHDPKYVEAMRRLHDGAIGDITGGQVYWNQGGLWNVERQPGMSDVEWQIRNWLYFTWASGDHVVEQHIHNLDVANWLLGGTPVRANGVGGRQVRVDPSYGHIFDHFAVELEYANGARLLSMCRQQDGTARYVGEYFIGTRGTSDGSSWIRGAREWRWSQQGEPVNPYVQEHADLVASIAAGRPLNEGRRVAESTLTAIMVREAAYTGQEIRWDAILASDLDLSPGITGFGSLPVPPVPAPGITQLSRPPFDHAHPAPTTGGR